VIQVARKKITKTVVDNARGKDAFIWDTDLRGFGLRVRGATKSYLVKYGAGRRGRSRWMTIGRHGAPWGVDPATNEGITLTAEIARQEALRLLGLKASGRDPAAERRAARGIPTFAEFGDRYLEEYAVPHLGKDTVKGVRLNLRKINKAIGGLRLDLITGADVTRFHVARKETPVNANHCLALISSMFTRAAEWGILPSNHASPTAHVRRYGTVKRQRFLNTAELARLGAALRDIEEEWPFVVGAIRVLIFTGARATEILSLKWDQVDLAKGVAMQRRKARGKTPLPIPLPPPAVAVLKSLPRLKGREWVFPSQRRLERYIGARWLSRQFIDIRKAADIEDVHVHDLRHCFASVGVARKHSLLMIQYILGHTEQKSTQRYAHLAQDAVQEAAEDIATEIEKAMKVEPKGA
jgi:integrase